MRILSIVPLWIESNAFLKSMKHSNAVKLFFFTSLMILLKARIWLTVVLPSLKLFWLFFRRGSMASLIRFSIMRLKSFAMTQVSLMPQQLCGLDISIFGNLDDVRQKPYGGLEVLYQSLVADLQYDVVKVAVFSGFRGNAIRNNYLMYLLQ